jgi:ribosomal protein L39E
MNEVVVMNLGEAIEMAKEHERQNRVPAWKRYYVRHRKQELARRKEYRDNHKEAVAEYNHSYYQSRKLQKAVARGKGGLIKEVSHA